MHVRSLRHDDIEVALALWARTENLGSVSRAEVEQVLAHDPGLVLVAEHGGELVGVVLGTYDGRRGWIQRLAVDPDARRGGIGRALVAELEQRLVDRGCRQVNLLVYHENRDGRAFWASVGYEGTDRIALYRRRLDGTDPEPDPHGVASGRVRDC